MNEAAKDTHISAETVPSSRMGDPLACSLQERDGQVYFISNGDAVKIGFSKCAENRLAQLQRHEHRELKLIACFNAPMSFERELHARFDHLWINGEWFKLDKEIVDYLEKTKI